MVNKEERRSVYSGRGSVTSAEISHHAPLLVLHGVDSQKEISARPGYVVLLKPGKCHHDNAANRKSQSVLAVHIPRKGTSADAIARGGNVARRGRQLPRFHPGVHGAGGRDVVHPKKGEMVPGLREENAVYDVGQGVKRRVVSIVVQPQGKCPVTVLYFQTRVKHLFVNYDEHPVGFQALQSDG